MLHKDVSVEFTNFVCSCWNQIFQHLTNAFGGMGMLGIYWAIVMTMQPSLTTMKTVIKQPASKRSWIWLMHKGYQEKYHESGTQKEMQEQCGPGKESESSLARSFATQNRCLVVVRIRYSVSHCNLCQELWGKILSYVYTK